MKMSVASSTSAQPMAKERKMVFLGGDVRRGILSPIRSSGVSLGTSRSPVSAEPPMARRSMASSTCRRAPSDPATRFAASSSAAGAARSGS